MASTVAAGLGGILLARTVGPSVRGEYAAITAWFGVALMVGGMGQPAALCFYVAHDPARAPEYVATSRAMMLVTGGLALTGGTLLAPLLAHGNDAVTTGYRIAFAASIVAFVGASYTFSLQARDLQRWNVVRVSQPVLSLAGILMLWRLRSLTLQTALIVLAVTMLLQLAWAYRSCRLTGLVPGTARARLVRPLTAYGAAQIVALTPAAVNSRLDQLVLSQTVPPADLGRYAVAVSLTLLPLPVVAAIGHVTFPMLASQRTMTPATYRLQRAAVIGSAVLATAMLAPLASVAHWLIPWIYGAAYRSAVPLLWVLTPGAIFLSCNQVVGDLLRGRNRPIVVARAEGLAAMFTVVLLIALLPVVGVYGAAIASTVAYGVSLVVLLWSLHRLPGREYGSIDGKMAWPERFGPDDGKPMSMIRRNAAASTDLACRILGRDRVVRAARFVLYRARLDVPNDPRSNGEMLLQRWVLNLAEPGEAMHVLDVGANVGEWSRAMLAAAQDAGRLGELDLHAFEPSVYTFARLAESLNGQSVNLLQFALSDFPGSAPLYILAPGAGTNSLHRPHGTGGAVTTEDVAITSLDSYAEHAGLDRLALVKIDTEGNDLAVLRGARTLFSQQRILVAQFEYNHRWVYSRCFLRDAFELLEPLGYRVGKLTPRGVEFYRGWDAELETFVEGNYVACPASVVARLPSVNWWKSAHK
ncbi:MAG: FkbM family methyltransferase [Streptosporangiaceae bacterium]